MTRRRGALQVIREKGVGERIVYFYVVDDERPPRGRPARRGGFLTAAADAHARATLMLRRVVAIPRTATLLDACDLFVLHKFFAFPVDR